MMACFLAKVTRLMNVKQSFLGLGSGHQDVIWVAAVGWSIQEIALVLVWLYIYRLYKDVIVVVVVHIGRGEVFAHNCHTSGTSLA